MAYILGFFTADGSMINNKRGAHFIELEIIDRNLLEQIRRLLGSSHKISVRKRSNKWRTTYRLQIGSKVIFNNLLKLGLTPHKSKRIKLPYIPQEYFSHFVRGYFDGDGHVAISQYFRKNRKNKKTRVILSGFTSGSKKFLENLHILLKRLAGIVGGSLFYSRGHRLSFSTRDTSALYRFLYKGNTAFFLARKKKIFEKYLGA